MYFPSEVRNSLVSFWSSQDIVLICIFFFFVLSAPTASDFPLAQNTELHVKPMHYNMLIDLLLEMWHEYSDYS